MNFKHIHHSWSPLLSEFNTDAFLYFKNELLPKEKYYPEADEVFRVFSMPVSEIKVVLIAREEASSIVQEGLFFLRMSLTYGANTDHNEYWAPFIKKVIYFIARSNPCIWLMPTTKSQSYTANLPAKTIFNVMKYDDETIHQIPISVDYNYVFKGIYINFKHINILLKKRGKTELLKF
jgi:uracil DNA glycosylase